MSIYVNACSVFACETFMAKALSLIMDKFLSSHMQDCFLLPCFCFIFYLAGPGRARMHAKTRLGGRNSASFCSNQFFGAFEIWKA